MTDSPMWLTFGWTMLHFLWLGGLVGLFTLMGRSLLSSSRPALREWFTRFAFAAFVALPVLLFLRLAPAMTSEEVSWVLPDHVAMMTGSIPASASASSSGSTGSFLEFGARWLPWVWLIGAPGIALWFLAGLHGLGRWRRDAQTPGDGSLMECCARWTRLLRIPFRVQVRLTHKLTTPVVVGILRPCVLLPVALVNGLTPRQLELILVHELMHVRRLDNLVILLQRLAECTLFFHPVVWLFSTWLDRDREDACDRGVLDRAGPADEYARTLLAVAMNGAPAPRMGNAFSAGSLRHRIQQILKTPEVSMSMTSRWTAALSLAGVLGTLLAAAPLAAHADDEKPEPVRAIAVGADPSQDPPMAKLQVEPAGPMQPMFPVNGVVDPDLTAEATPDDPPCGLAWSHPLNQTANCTDCHVSETVEQWYSPHSWRSRLVWTSPHGWLSPDQCVQCHQPDPSGIEWGTPWRPRNGVGLRWFDDGHWRPGTPDQPSPRNARDLLKKLEDTDLSDLSDEERLELREVLFKMLQRLLEQDERRSEENRKARTDRPSIVGAGSWTGRSSGR